MNDMDNKNLKHLMEQAWPVPTMPTGGRERFAQKLSASRQSSHRHWPWGIGISVMGVAATIIAIFFMLQPDANAPADDAFAGLNVHTGIAEVRGYYKAKMWSETEYILELTEYMKPNLREKLLAEVKMLSESPDSIVKNILQEEIDNDDKLVYVTSVYMQYLRSLEYIHQVLNENKQAYLNESKDRKIRFNNL